MNDQLRTMIFKVVPYSNEIIEEVSSLSESELYQLFSKTTISSETLTAALHLIHKLESSAISESEPSLLSAHLFDEMLFSSRLSNLAIYPYVFVLLINGTYGGHLYAWIIDNLIINIIAIRMSIHYNSTHYLSTLIDRVREWSFDKVTESYRIRVIQPTGSLLSLLREEGFITLKEIGSNPEAQQLFDNSSIGDVPLIEMLLFREYDYISQ